MVLFFKIAVSNYLLIVSKKKYKCLNINVVVVVILVGGGLDVITIIWVHLCFKIFLTSP